MSSVYILVSLMKMMTFRKALDNRGNKKISTDYLTKMTEYGLKSNYFEFNGKVKKQIPGTAIVTKSASPYACIFMG